jgi:hypothetical protein
VPGSIPALLATLSDFPSAEPTTTRTPTCAHGVRRDEYAMSKSAYKVTYDLVRSYNEDDTAGTESRDRDLVLFIRLDWSAENSVHYGVTDEYPIVDQGGDCFDEVLPWHGLIHWCGPVWARPLNELYGVAIDPYAKWRTLRALTIHSWTMHEWDDLVVTKIERLNDDYEREADAPILNAGDERGGTPTPHPARQRGGEGGVS